MITLATPCRALADTEPLTVDRDDLVSEISEDIKDVHYRAAVAVDRAGKPVGLVTRSIRLAPAAPVLLVDHAEQAQSVPGVEEAEIVEILDHCPMARSETRIRCGRPSIRSTATLVVERFRQNGMEPSAPAAAMLLAAVLSDTVLLNSPTATERDRAVVDFLESALRVDAMEFGGEMFEAGSDRDRHLGRRHRPPRPGCCSRTAARWRSPRSRSSARASSSAAASCARRSSGCATRTGARSPP